MAERRTSRRSSTGGSKSRSTARGKSITRKSSRSKSASTKSSGRKYSPGASKDVESAMRRRKRGTLRSGGSGKKVRSREQAIAVGLSEARKKGKKVPPPPKD